MAPKLAVTVCRVSAQPLKHMKHMCVTFAHQFASLVLHMHQYLHSSAACEYFSEKLVQKLATPDTLLDLAHGWNEITTSVQVENQTPGRADALTGIHQQR